MSANDIPCRVSAELRQYQRKLDEQFEKAAERKFDPMDDALMTDLFGKTMAQPLANLLLALEGVELTEQSFGVDKEKAFDFLRHRLAALKDACLKVYEEDQ